MATHHDTQFRPFIPELRKEVFQALNTLLGFTSDVEVDFEQLRPPSNDGIGALRVFFNNPGQPKIFIDFGEAKDGQRAWHLQGDYFLSYGSHTEGYDPLGNPEQGLQLNHLKSIAEKIFNEAPNSLSELNVALGKWRSFDGINDSMYRQLSNHPALGQVANLRLGFRCNQDCWFCWQGRQWPEPPDEFYDTWLDELANTGVRSLSITGGEPTIHKALPRLVAKATHEYRMFVSVQTNAIQFAKPAFMAKMIEGGLEEVFVSFHAADADISDRMTRAPRTHALTVKGIEACLDAGIKVYLNCVVERENYKDIANHARLIAERFVTPYPSNPVRKVTYSHPCSYYDGKLWEQTLVPLDDLKPILLETAKTLHDKRVYVDVVGSCGFPPCLFKDEPDLVQWANPDAFDPSDVSGRHHPEPCQECAFKTQCLGVRKEYLDLYGTRGITPFLVAPGS